jgi:antitoxin CptB
MDARRKKLLFRSQHCGMKENDFLLGRFAAAHVASLNDADLAAFEALLFEPDNDIYNWVTAKEPAPAEHDTPLMAALIAFNDPK